MMMMMIMMMMMGMMMMMMIAGYRSLFVHAENNCSIINIHTSIN
jgi:hypothetical protein